MADDTQTVTVDVTPAWASKINITQVVAAIAVLATLFTSGKFSISPEQQLAIVTTIGVLAQAATVILRTWFVTTVTKQAAKKCEIC